MICYWEVRFAIFMKISFNILMLLIVFNCIPLHALAEENEELSSAVKGGIGCAAFTGATLLGALASGPGELIMIAGGGSLAPSATTPLMVSLTATVFVAACSIGMAATPALLWFYEQAGVLFERLWGVNETANVNQHYRATPILTSNNEPSLQKSATN